MIKELLVLGFLSVNAFSDVVKQQILLWTIPICVIPGYWLLADQLSLVAVVALLPGCLLLVIGKFTQEAIGYGDGLIVLILGIYLGIWETCEVVLLALFLSAVWGGILMMGKKKGLQQEFPWVPWLLIAYVGKLVFTC